MHRAPPHLQRHRHRCPIRRRRGQLHRYRRGRGPFRRRRGGSRSEGRRGIRRVGIRYGDRDTGRRHRRIIRAAHRVRDGSAVGIRIGVGDARYGNRLRRAPVASSEGQGGGRERRHHRVAAGGSYRHLASGLRIQHHVISDSGSLLYRDHGRRNRHAPGVVVHDRQGVRRLRAQFVVARRAGVGIGLQGRHHHQVGIFYRVVRGQGHRQDAAGGAPGERQRVRHRVAHRGCRCHYGHRQILGRRRSRGYRQIHSAVALGRFAHGLRKGHRGPGGIGDRHRVLHRAGQGVAGAGGQGQA